MKMLCALVAALVWVPLLRADDQAPDAEKHAPVYFDATKFDARAVLPAPPPVTSDATVREIEILFQAQSVRTPEQVTRIEEEDKYNVFDLQAAVGAWFTVQNMSELPVTNTLLARVMETVLPIAATAKDDFQRPRPFLANSRLFPSLTKPTDSSYPSTHSVRAMLDALILADIVPGGGNAVFARARQIGDDRVIAGVAYPSDVIAGRKLAQAIYSQLSSQEEFRDDEKAARDEIKAYLLRTRQ